MMMVSSTKSLENLIRKIKKKLRQIENLERSNRPLFDEELVKVKSKVSLRQQLKETLGELDELKEEESDNEGESQEQSYETDLSKSSFEQGDWSHNSYSYANSSDFRVDDEVVHMKEEDTVRKDYKSPDIFNKQNDQHQEENVSLACGDGNFEKQTLSTESKPQTHTETKKVKKAKEKSTKGSSLSKKFCRVTSLEGHNDLVTSLMVVGDKLISASRDTTLRSWNIHTRQEEHIFGGHTEYITCVAVLDKAWNHKFDPVVPDDDQIIVSGSFDCTLKIWSLNTGSLIKSVYTFNPITCLCVCQEHGLVISGSDGGKLELWELWTGRNCWSKIVYDGAVTGVKISGDSVFSASSTGVIKVHQLSEGQTLMCVFESENLKSPTGRRMRVRHVRCLEVAPTGVLYGDDARNVKIVDWKKGVVHKVSNHTNSFSSIDAICCHGDYLVSSSYDLSTGLSYMNVRCSQTLEYLGSIDDENTERLVCLAAQSFDHGRFTVFSGGMELKIWEVAENCSKSSAQQTDTVVISIQHRAHLSRRAVDSDSEASSDEEGRDSVEETDDERVEEGDQDEVVSNGWGSWCNIL